MKKYQKLSMFPLGSIKAEGFLKDQLVISKDGMAGHLYELEPEMIAEPYVKDTHVGVWAGRQRSQVITGQAISSMPLLWTMKR